MRVSELTAYAPPTPSVCAATPRSLAAEWPRVRIEDVRVFPADSHGRTHAVVHACVHLGALLPADVRVELVRAAGHDRAHARLGETAERLWSVQSYCNGMYVFESAVPRRSVEAPAGAFVRVTPAPDVPGAGERPAVLRWVAPWEGSVRPAAGRGRTPAPVTAW